MCQFSYDVEPGSNLNGRSSKVFERRYVDNAYDLSKSMIDSTGHGCVFCCVLRYFLSLQSFPAFSVDREVVKNGECERARQDGRKRLTWNERCCSMP